MSDSVHPSFIIGGIEFSPASDGSMVRLHLKMRSGSDDDFFIPAELLSESIAQLIGGAIICAQNLEASDRNRLAAINESAFIFPFPASQVNVAEGPDPQETIVAFSLGAMRISFALTPAQSGRLAEGLAELRQTHRA